MSKNEIPLPIDGHPVNPPADGAGPRAIESATALSQHATGIMRAELPKDPKTPTRLEDPSYIDLTEAPYSTHESGLVPPKYGQFRQADEEQWRRLEMKDANILIGEIPDAVRNAATSGNDSAQMMRVAPASSSSNDTVPPQLDAAQQKVFDALKTQGLNPSIEKEFYGQERQETGGQYYQEIGDRAWVLKANWKDGQNPLPELQTLAHQGQKRVRAVEEQWRQQVQQQQKMKDYLKNIPGSGSGSRW